MPRDKILPPCRLLLPLIRHSKVVLTISPPALQVAFGVMRNGNATVTLDALAHATRRRSLFFCEWESVTMTLNGALRSCLRWYENGTLVS